MSERGAHTKNIPSHPIVEYILFMRKLQSIQQQQSRRLFRLKGVAMMKLLLKTGSYGSRLHIYINSHKFNAIAYSQAIHTNKLLIKKQKFCFLSIIYFLLNIIPVFSYVDYKQFWQDLANMGQNGGLIQNDNDFGVYLLFFFIQNVLVWGIKDTMSISTRTGYTTGCYLILSLIYIFL